MHKILKSFYIITHTKKGISVFLPIIILFFVFLFLIVLLLQNIGRANAQITSFYSTVCLGGWENTDKAMGVPDAIEKNDTNYNESNSASVFNAITQIFCGGFKGELPQDAIHKKVILKFSWATENTTSSIEENPEIINGEETIQTEESAEEELIENENTSTEETNAPVKETLEIETIPVLELESALELEIEQPSTENPESTPATEPAEDLSFIRKLFFDVVYAEDAEEIVTEETIQTEESAEEELIENKPPASEDSETEIIDNNSPEETIPIGAIFEVRYTLDGIVWESLGYISEINNDVSLEMPIDIFTSIADLERIQIALHTLPMFDTLPKIYLDAIWLEVQYENEETEIKINQEQSAVVLNALEESEIEEIPAEIILPPEPIPLIEEIKLELPLKLTERTLDKLITTDKDAKHKCKVSSYSSDISNQNSTTVELALLGERNGIENLEIGSLPLGIDITFSKNGGYSYSPTKEDDFAVLQIINQLGSQKGNFSIPIIYTVSDSSIICQINILNF